MEDAGGDTRDTLRTLAGAAQQDARRYGDAQPAHRRSREGQLGKERYEREPDRCSKIVLRPDLKIVESLILLLPPTQTIQLEHPELEPSVGELGNVFRVGVGVLREVLWPESGVAVDAGASPTPRAHVLQLQ